VPAYRHDDLGPQLTAVASLIGQMMNEITFGPEQVVRFTEASGGWLAELPDAFLAVRNRYYLVVSGMADADQLGTTLPRDAKLGAPNEVDDFVNRSLPGVELLYLQVPPSGMPRRSGAVYFRIEQMSEAWASVLRSRAAVLFFPEAPKQFIAELVAVTR
jgi:type VI secretion system protein ImpJ